MTRPPFDGLQETMYSITTNVFGYDASWTPSAGGAAKTAKVHFKEPTQEYELSGFEYSPQTFILEFKKGDFTGLHESANSGGLESVVIEGTTYNVLHVKPVSDGNTFRAVLKRI